MLAARLFTTLALVSQAAPAVTCPHDESAGAKANIASALVAAKTDKKPLLVMFGANWCGDCKMLDMAF